MENRREITPAAGPIRASIRPPGSKSITNRALVCAALAEGASTLRGALDSEDTQVMIAGLQSLGIAIELRDGGETLVVAGCGGDIPSSEADLYVAGSGTTMRFLAALCTLGNGRYRLHGIPRMHERPIGDLMRALRALGADIKSENDNDCPPVIVSGQGLRGGRADVAGDVSSQFLSGLLMTAPYADGPVELSVRGALVSQPYVRMTLRVMQAFGMESESPDLGMFKFPGGQRYRAQQYDIEPDASAASYFFAAAAITGGEMTVEGLGRDSLQGDVRFCECLESMGCAVEYDEASITVRGKPLSGIDVDMNNISDTVQTLAAVALFADGPTRIRGIAHNRYKETDRIAALASELRKLGATVTEHDDGLTIQPAELHGAEIETYDDHRMAMSLSLAGLRIPGVVILDPGCTRKTYPRFFEDLERIRGTCSLNLKSRFPNGR